MNRTHPSVLPRQTSVLSRQTLLAACAAVALLGGYNAVHAQANPPSQVNPTSTDSNRQATQGLVPPKSQADQRSASGNTASSARSRINAPGSDLRNDRNTTTRTARAPRADRN